MKPQPPKNLWEQLEAIRTENHPPQGSFSTRQFAEQFRITPGAAYDELRGLCRKGAVERVGRFGSETYYKLVN